METDTLFRIYSMSKAITTAAALMLVDDGKMALDDPVSRYLPELKGVKIYGKDGGIPPSREMTGRDLMRHTAGLTYGSFGNTEVDQQYREAQILAGTLDEQAEKLGRLPLLYDPDTQWVYSVATDVLGLVIERVSEKPFPRFLQERLFDPLAMPDTAFYVTPAKVDRFATAYQSDGKGA